MVEKWYIKIIPLNLERQIHVYLPKDYFTSSKNYPVLYMFDGHNLFFDEDATFGSAWKMNDYLDQINGDLIIVGIECNHEGNQRLIEFSPYAWKKDYFCVEKPLGKVFMQWIVEELKPMIDQKYRTQPQKETTGIGGSSMGGLMAMYGALSYPEIFSKAACLSSSFSFCEKELIQLIEQHSSYKNSKFYMDFGSEESRSKKGLAYMTKLHLGLAHLLMQKEALCYPNMIVNGKHNEQTWSKQVPVFLEYLYKIK